MLNNLPKFLSLVFLATREASFAAASNSPWLASKNALTSFCSTFLLLLTSNLLKAAFGKFKNASQILSIKIITTENNINIKVNDYEKWERFWKNHSVTQYIVKGGFEIIKEKKE